VRTERHNCLSSQRTCHRRLSVSPFFHYWNCWTGWQAYLGKVGTAIFSFTCISLSQLGLHEHFKPMHYLVSRGFLRFLARLDANPCGCILAVGQRKLGLFTIMLFCCCRTVDSAVRVSLRSKCCCSWVCFRLAGAAWAYGSELFDVEGILEALRRPVVLPHVLVDLCTTVGEKVTRIPVSSCIWMVSWLGNAMPFTPAFNAKMSVSGLCLPFGRMQPRTSGVSENIRTCSCCASGDILRFWGLGFFHDCSVMGMKLIRTTAAGLLRFMILRAFEFA